MQTFNLRRNDDTIIASINANNFKEAVEIAVKSKINLRDISLDYQDLSEINLVGANMENAGMYMCNLTNTNIRRADLSYANLSRSILKNTDMSLILLYYANLYDCHFNDTIINIRSHETLGEILRQEANEDLEKLKVAAFITVSTNLCWEDFVRLDDPLKQWAIDTLYPYVKRSVEDTHHVLTILKPYLTLSLVDSGGNLHEDEN